MTLTFDEAYEKLDSIVESTLLDLEIASLQESAEDEDYYDEEFLDENVYTDGKGNYTGEDKSKDPGWKLISSADYGTWNSHHLAGKLADRSGKLEEFRDKTAAAATEGLKANQEKLNANPPKDGKGNPVPYAPARNESPRANTKRENRLLANNQEQRRKQAEHDAKFGKVSVTLSKVEETDSEAEIKEKAKKLCAAEGKEPTPTNINYYVRVLKAQTRKEEGEARRAENAGDSKVKAIAKTIARGLVKVFQMIKKVFGVIRDFFAKIGGKSFQLESSSIKGVIDYSCVSKVCNYVDGILRRGATAHNAGNTLNSDKPGTVVGKDVDGNDFSVTFNEQQYTAYEEECYKVVPKGTLINPANVAKVSAYASNAASKYETLADSLENAKGGQYSAGQVQMQGKVLRKVAAFLKKISEKANELKADIGNSAKAVNTDSKFAKGAKAGTDLANAAGKRAEGIVRRKYANESVSILLAQANELLSEGATDEAMTLMATASSLMEGAEEYTQGIGTDMSAPDDIDQTDAEVADDAYPAEDVTGGEGQDPDEDIKEVLGGDTVALKLMTDDEGNELVDESAEEIEIIL